MNIYQIEYERYLFFKRIKIFLIGLFLSFAAAFCMKILTRGNDIVQVGDFSYELNSSTMTAKIIGYQGSGTSITIDETVTYQDQDYYITTIGEGAFREKNIFSVTGNFIKKIEQSAFDGCEGLKKANFPNATYIGNRAFAICDLPRCCVA